MTGSSLVLCHIFGGEMMLEREREGDLSTQCVEVCFCVYRLPSNKARHHQPLLHRKNSTISRQTCHLAEPCVIQPPLPPSSLLSFLLLLPLSLSSLSLSMSAPARYHSHSFSSKVSKPAGSADKQDENPSTYSGQSISITPQPHLYSESVTSSTLALIDNSIERDRRSKRFVVYILQCVPLCVCVWFGGIWKCCVP